jgi:hypothetical protein
MMTLTVRSTTLSRREITEPFIMGIGVIISLRWGPARAPGFAALAISRRLSLIGTPSAVSSSDST